MVRIGVVVVALLFFIVRCVSADALEKAVTAVLPSVVGCFDVFSASVDAYLVLVLALANAPFVMSKHFFWEWKAWILIPRLSLPAGR
jgi:dolichyl-phosphate-mannose--protein O-mannosyl transferase